MVHSLCVGPDLRVDRGSSSDGRPSVPHRNTEWAPGCPLPPQPDCARSGKRVRRESRASTSPCLQAGVRPVFECEARWWGHDLTHSGYWPLGRRLRGISRRLRNGWRALRGGRDRLQRHGITRRELHINLRGVLTAFHRLQRGVIRVQAPTHVRTWTGREAGGRLQRTACEKDAGNVLKKTGLLNSGSLLRKKRRRAAPEDGGGGGRGDAL